MAIAININEQVRVKLTDYGREVERKYLTASFSQILPPKNRNRFVKICTRKADILGYTEWQLWELMQVFSPELSFGEFKPLFEKNNLYIGNTW